MADRKKKSQNQEPNINVTIHGNVIGSNVVTGNQNQASISAYLSALQTPLPIYQNDSDLHQAGDLPLGSHLPFSPNALFTGREKELKDLAENLLGDSKTGAVITQAVTGMGGLGKTQLAIEFGYRYGKYFRGVHWINLADPTQLDSEIANCGRGMFSKDFPEDQPSQVALTLKTWKENGPNLLILDNFEETKLASDVLTILRHSNIRVLVTSRHTDWSPTLGLTQLPLDLFSEEESLQFLKDSLKERKDSEEDLKNLAERLGHLPLGLELASRYLKDKRLSIKEYLNQTENALDHASMKNWRADMPAATGHDLDLQKTFALSWQELKDEIAQKIFMMAGYLAPNTPIPLEIFERALEISQEKCDEALNVLYGLGLFRKGENDLPVIHPLLAEYSQILAKADKEILETLANVFGRLSNQKLETGIPASFLPIRPHIPVLAVHAEDEKLQNAGALWNNYGLHLVDIADYQDARKMYEKAIKFLGATFGIEHPEIAASVNNLGLLLYDLGELDEAKKMFEEALEINKVHFGPNHYIVAANINNIGLVIKNLGNLIEARKMFEQALNIDEANFGAGHPNVARAINNLASVIKDLGDLKLAKSLFERSLKINKAHFGEYHPNIALDISNLADIMRDLGDLQGARTMLESSLKINENHFGLEHPYVAKDISNLAGVIKELGDIELAQAMFERALRIQEKVYGKRHPDIAVVLSWLGTISKEQGNKELAKNYFENALEICKKFLPLEHPNIRELQVFLDLLNE